MKWTKMAGNKVCEIKDWKFIIGTVNDAQEAGDPVYQLCVVNKCFRKMFYTEREAKRFARELVEGTKGRCKTCGRCTLDFLGGGYNDCVNCWEVERRLGQYLESAGGRAFVRKLLAKHKPHQRNRK